MRSPPRRYVKGRSLGETLGRIASSCRRSETVLHWDQLEAGEEADDDLLRLVEGAAVGTTEGKADGDRLHAKACRGRCNWTG
jgi:hypothetical protein